MDGPRHPQTRARTAGNAALRFGNAGFTGNTHRPRQRDSCRCSNRHRTAVNGRGWSAASHPLPRSQQLPQQMKQAFCQILIRNKRLSRDLCGVAARRAGPPFRKQALEKQAFIGC